MEDDFEEDCDDDDDALLKGQEWRTRVGWQWHQPPVTDQLLPVVFKTSCGCGGTSAATRLSCEKLEVQNEASLKQTCGANIRWPQWPIIDKAASSYAQDCDKWWRWWMVRAALPKTMKGTSHTFSPPDGNPWDVAMFSRKNGRWRR
jgi:hypothetical protein